MSVVLSTHVLDETDTQRRSLAGIMKLLKDRTVMGSQGSLVSESMFPFKRPCSEIVLGVHSWVQPAGGLWKI